MASEPFEIPHGLQRIYRRFVHWRGAHPGVRLPVYSNLQGAFRRGFQTPLPDAL
jgi:hypothetical protein